MFDLNGYEIEALRIDREPGVFRARKEGAGSILLIAPAPGDGQLASLEHELSLAGELEPAWAARPLALAQHDDRIVLVTEDPGGLPLDVALRSGALAPKRAVEVGIAVAAALQRLHERGLIHKDVKPANVMTDAAGRAWLMGFGIASRAQEEAQAPVSPDFISGTLAYMAPEQTGRMNRSVDARCDLYALGVTLYELVAGTLPFAASDALEWIHSHIAREPMCLSRRSPAVPRALGAVVAKLLSKNPEDRYQTAFGVEADLRLCLAIWSTGEELAPFPLGEADRSDRLQIPEKLYGRESLVETLHEVFTQAVHSNTTQLVLVSGCAGIGKSSAVAALQRLTAAARSLFAVGRLAQYQGLIPYAPFAHAIRDLVETLLTKSEAELAHWRTAMLDALGGNGLLLIHLVPELALILGEQPPVAELPLRDATRRFQLVFQRFIGVFSRPEHPLVLFLDDLQWLDAATLDLLEFLGCEAQPGPLLLVGAYRDDEVDSAHPLASTLKTLREKAVITSEIALAPLTSDDMERLLSDTLHVERWEIAPLAARILDKTAGNPFFARQFIAMLAERELLAFDATHLRWRWDIGRIGATQITDNVAELLTEKLKRLAPRTQAAVAQLACLGGANGSVLAGVCECPESQLHEDLRDAVRSGLVTRTAAGYAFIHDRVQEAAHRLIPPENRAQAHLHIARVLSTQLSTREQAQKIFEIVEHWKRGGAHIHALDERERVAALAVSAAKRAKASTAYASAHGHLVLACTLLAEGPWQPTHALRFETELLLSECEFFLGDLAAADRRLTELAELADDVPRLAAVARVRVILYTTQNRLEAAVAVGLSYLRHVGIDWPAHPTQAEVHAEVDRLWELLAGRPIESLIDLPRMTDPNWLATVDVLVEFMPTSLFSDAGLADLVFLRIANLSLEHGNCDGSCASYCVLMLVLKPYLDDYQVGFRFGRLACDLVEKRGMRRYAARVYLSFSAHILPWTTHLSPHRWSALRGFEAGNAAGDVTGANYSLKALLTSLLLTAEPLATVQREAERAFALANKARYGLAANGIAGLLTLTRRLRADPAAENDDPRVEQTANDAPSGHALAASWNWTYRLQWCVYAREIDAALEAALAAERLVLITRAFMESADFQFFGALTRAAACDTRPAAERAEHLQALIAHDAQLQLWAKKCPENFTDRASLVAAELARVCGRELEAEHLYERAIQAARRYGFLQHEALAHELAARFYAQRGFPLIAETYRAAAWHCYQRWGAEGKLRLLENEHPQLRAQRAARAVNDTIGTSIDQLDARAILKASHAISSELELGAQLERLMRITIENAGAEQGVLVLLRDGEQRMAARATLRQRGDGALAVTLHERVVTAADLPLSMLNYVVRTRKSVLLDDASSTNQFADDVYLTQRPKRSVLCIPITKQASTIAVLYLENNLTPRAFTADRIRVLELLATQAASSLENAYLYDDLRRSEALLAEGQRMSHTGSWSWQLANDKLTWSDELQRIFGHDPEQAPAATRASFLERVHPDDLPEVQRAFDLAVQEPAAFVLDFRALLPDGTIKYLHALGRPVRDARGEVYAYLGATMDVTERKRSEDALRDAQADLVHVSRLTTMGELAASIAHEVSQPLTAIISNADACVHWLSLQPPNAVRARTVAERVASDAHHTARVIEGIRSVLRKSSGELVPLDLDGAITQVLDLLRRELRRHQIALELALGCRDAVVAGDRVQLQQVIVNLALNGIEAMKDAGLPRILRVTTEPQDAYYALVSVSDTGVGFDPDQVDRMFDAFFTTKQTGMGMGLAICRSIVEAHRGTLWVATRTGGGSTFQFTLPFQPR